MTSTDTNKIIAQILKYCQGHTYFFGMQGYWGESYIPKKTVFFWDV